MRRLRVGRVGFRSGPRARLLPRPFGIQGAWSYVTTDTRAKTSGEIAAPGHFSLLRSPNCGKEESSPTKRIGCKETLMKLCRVVAAAGTLIVGLTCSVGAQSARPGPDEIIDNPPFASWAQFKPGTIVM